MQVQSAGYEILRSLYLDWTNDRFPLVTEASFQDNIQSLTLRCSGKKLLLGMNLAYLRDRSIPVTVTVYERGDEQRVLDGDLLDTSFLTELDVLMEEFRPEHIVINDK